MNKYIDETLPLIRQLWGTEANTETAAHAYFTNEFYTTAQSYRDVEKRMASLVINFLLKNGMLCHPLTIHDGGGTHRFYLERYDIRSPLTEHQIHPANGNFMYEVLLTAPKHHDVTRVRWTRNTVPGDFMLLAAPGLPSLSRYEGGVRWPMLSALHAIPEEIEDVVSRTDSLNKWTKTTVFFGIEHLMVVFFRVIEDVIDHPLSVLRALFMDDVNRPAYLRNLHTLLPETTEIIDDLFATVLVMSQFYFRSLLLVHPTPHKLGDVLVENCMDELTAGLQMLLASNMRCAQAHNLVRHHDCFWLDKLIPWVKYERNSHNRRILNPDPDNRDPDFYTYFLNDTLKKQIYNLDHFFMLKLYGLNVHGLAREMYQTDSPDEPFLSIQARTGPILALQMGFEIPDYSAEKYAATTTKFIHQVRKYCTRILATISTRRYQLHRDMLLLAI